MRVSVRTGRRLLFVAGIYLGGIAVLTLLVGDTRESHEHMSIALIATGILWAFVFETLDLSAGMRLGTSLAPSFSCWTSEPCRSCPPYCRRSGNRFARRDAAP